MLDNFCDMRVVLGRCEGVVIIELVAAILGRCEGVIIIELVVVILEGPLIQL